MKRPKICITAQDQSRATESGYVFSGILALNIKILRFEECIKLLNHIKELATCQYLILKTKQISRFLETN